MKMKPFGRTGLEVSELGFGAWAIGGTSYGAVERSQALAALARAEELGCNLVDTAQVYGNSESIIGEFLKGRRDRWVVATKYSGQPEGLTRTAHGQLRRLGVSEIDFFQIHWAPTADGKHLYDELGALKEVGLARAIGVSLYTRNDVDYVLSNTELDGIQIPFSLLDPQPLLGCLERVKERKLGVLVRSVLKDGFLTGKYGVGARFEAKTDRRAELKEDEIRELLRKVDAFRFLEGEGQDLTAAAVRYPLSYGGVSSVLVGTKNPEQADANFGRTIERTLSPEELVRIAETQRRLGLGQTGIGARVSGLVRRLVGKLGRG